MVQQYLCSMYTSFMVRITTLNSASNFRHTSHFLFILNPYPPLNLPLPVLHQLLQQLQYRERRLETPAKKQYEVTF